MINCLSGEEVGVLQTTVMADTGKDVLIKCLLDSNIAVDWFKDGKPVQYLASEQ